MSVIAAGGVVYRTAPTLEVVLVVPVREPNRWALPKGHQDPGETIAATALREVREETGLEAEIETDLGFSEYHYPWNGTQVHKRVYYYLMRPLGGSFEHHDQEMTQVVWVPLAQALEQITFASEREILYKAQAYLLK